MGEIRWENKLIHNTHPLGFFVRVDSKGLRLLVSRAGATLVDGPASVEAEGVGNEIKSLESIEKSGETEKT